MVECETQLLDPFQATFMCDRETLDYAALRLPTLYTGSDIESPETWTTYPSELVSAWDARCSRSQEVGTSPVLNPRMQ